MKPLFSLQIFLLALVTLYSSLGLAAAGGGTSMSTMIAQGVNLSAALGILIYFTRKPLAAYFHNRSQSFYAEAKRAEQSKKEAEQAKQEIFSKLQKLENESEKELARAHGDAEELKQKMMSEARLNSEKMIAGAQEQSVLERGQAVFLLREELLQKSHAQAAQKMKTEIDGKDLRRLKTEFVDKIQVVQ